MNLDKPKPRLGLWRRPEECGENHLFVLGAGREFFHGIRMLCVAACELHRAVGRRLTWDSLSDSLKPTPKPPQNDHPNCKRCLRALERFLEAATL